MRQLYFGCLLILVVGFSAAFGQTGSIGIGTDSPDPSALLELKSTAKGLLIPRLTTAQRQAIANPAKGLMVYDTDADQFYYNDGSVWIEAIGPQGATGPTGAQGPAGPQGARGT